MKKKTIAGVIALIAIVLVVFVAGCAEKGGNTTSTPTVTPTVTPTATAKEGDTVKVHYTGTLDDGTVFDSSIGREPLQFTLGEGQMIPGFEQGVLGMKLGESKTFTIPADQAYGPYYEELVWEISRDQLQPGMEPELGQRLQASQTNGQPIIVTIIEVSETNVTVDANRQLAGEDLTFAIQLIEIL
jgi:peptidylprolyl isomerase